MEGDGGGWSAGKRRWISAAIALHLAAVVVAPLATPARPGAMGPQAAVEAAEAVRPYLEPLHLQNGYKFFAPDPPGWTVRLRFDLQFADGRTETQILPDPHDWPRLRYHRKFMLAERHGESPEWPASYCEHLGRKTGAVQVTMHRQRERIPTLSERRSPDFAAEAMVGKWEPVVQWTP